MTTVELFSPEKHYVSVSSWWIAQKWPVIPLSHLPRFGIVVSDGPTPAAAGWIYQTDSAFCIFEWIVANPEIRGDPRDRALSLLIDEAKSAAKAMGFSTIFMSVRNQSLLKRLRDRGFTADDVNMTNLTLDLKGGG